jgi:hypothetical protein
MTGPVTAIATCCVAMIAVVHALTAAPAVGAPTRGSIEHELLARMNSGPDGTISRSAHCRPHGPDVFSCTIRSVGSTALDARVAVRDGDLQIVWSPLRG